MLKGYNVTYKVLNTKEHGVPQNRPRIYIVGIREDADRGSFAFPEPIPCPSLELFLDSRPSKAVAKRSLPPAWPSGKGPRPNVIAITRKLKREGSDPLEDPFVIDCDSTAGRAKAMHN